MNARKTTKGLTSGLGICLRHVGACLLAVLAIASQMGHTAADAERFEIIKVKAVRPVLMETVAALEKADVAGAKAAFAAYHSLFNGVEVYIGTRSKDAEHALEGIEAKIEKGLSAPNPDAAALLADAKAILAKYDETIDIVIKARPLNSLYDDLARLRIVRAHLREVVPALSAGHVEMARKSFAAFSSGWESVEDMVKAHAADDYAAIEKGMIEIEKLLEKPDVDGATALVKEVLAKYQPTHNALLKEARSK